LLQETAAAARRLLRHPFFALGLIVLLSIVLGSATAVSAVIGSYLLRPLPYPGVRRGGAIVTAEGSVRSPGSCSSCVS